MKQSKNYSFTASTKAKAYKLSDLNRENQQLLCDFDERAPRTGMNKKNEKTNPLLQKKRR